jgi:RsiW-degrading membrane proteinase PrsW (M82 family)
MGMESALRVAISLAPVLLFLAALSMMDSYKLVPKATIYKALAAGGGAALLCYIFNAFIFQRAVASQDQYAIFGAPVVEEFAKAAWWIFLIVSARTAFLIDSAICGFAIGAGFAVIENIFYLQVLEGRSMGVWALRGFGTAVMHGGVAALGAMISVYLGETRHWRGFRQFAPGLLVAIALHLLFNLGAVSPVVSTAFTIAILPLILGAAFHFSERSLRRWLEGKMDRDLDMLSMIARGEFGQTRAGEYLFSLHENFPAEIRADMLCLLQLSTELSIRAKGDLLLREVGIEPVPDPQLEARLRELRYLEKSIGPTGMMAIRPLLSRTPRDLWEMHRLAAAGDKLSAGG